MPAHSPASADSPADRIVAAALAEITDYGLRRISMDSIAKRAGMHRVTVYRSFRTKDEVLAAVMAAWLDQFMTSIAADVASEPTLEDRVVAGFALALTRMRAEPIVQRALTDDADFFIPLVTIRGGTTLAFVRDLLAAELNQGLDTNTLEDIVGISELMIRAALSLLLTPESHFPVDTEDDLRDFARNFLLPLVRRN